MTITILTIVKTWFLTLTRSPTIRATSVVCSFDFQTSYSIIGASHIRESLKKPHPHQSVGKILPGGETSIPSSFKSLGS